MILCHDILNSNRKAVSERYDKLILHLDKEELENHKIQNDKRASQVLNRDV